MKLYYSTGACSLSPHIALHEAGLSFEAVLAPTKTHKLLDGTDYYTINPLDLPLVDPNFLGERADMDRMVHGFRRMREILAQPALAQFGARELPSSAAAQTDVEIEQFIRRYADTIYHPVGSCRMGPGPMDVVDASLRVHGMQGLRVVDASIMPLPISGNTNAPSMVIGEKAAQLIRAGA